MIPKKILVLGSKPEAIVEAYDEAYCANASGHFYREELEHRALNGESTRVAVVSATELLDSERQSLAKQEWLESKREQITRTSVSELVLYWADIKPSARDYLKSIGYSKPVTEITSSDSIKLAANLSGVYHPVLSGFLFRFGWKNSLRWSRLWLIDLIRLLILKKSDIHGLFRPSTGIIALLVAISRHGTAAEYVLSGVGINSRELYPDEVNNTWASEVGLKVRHVAADLKILKALTFRYKIKVTDPDLALAVKHCHVSD